MKASAIQKAAAIGLLAVAATWFVTCDRGKPASVTLIPDGPDRDAAARCGHDVYIYAPPDSLATGHDSAITAIPVAGVLSNIPEYHDCQRLLDSTNRYGTLAGIWAAHNMAELADSLEFYRSQGPAAARTALSFAQVYAWDSAYAPLGIARRFNCLYLRQDLGAGGVLTWRAWMVRVGFNAGRCLAPIRPEEAGTMATELGIRPMTEAPTGNDMPDVTRWDWSQRPAAQYIGVKCGIHWCEAYQRGGFTSSQQYSAAFLPAALPPSAPPGSTPSLRHRVLAGKGWYDEQLLAPAGGAAAAIGPTPVWATVFPDPRLDGYAASGAFDAQPWLPSALIHIRPRRAGDAPQHFDDYRARYGFEEGWNVVSLCKRSRAECIPRPLGARARVQATCKTATPPHDRWWARVVSSRGNVMYLCVVRRAYPTSAGAISARGTTRWHWKFDDEPTWMSCANGCCELDA